MLADAAETSHVGAFDDALHLDSTFLRKVFDFIVKQAAPWRDDPKRRRASRETALTLQFSLFLSRAARHSELDHLVFQVECPDDVAANRTIDLSAFPVHRTIWISGREYDSYSMLIPIEAKRLPTPKGKDRDKREYLQTRKKKGGGIQRFRDSLHGANHEFGAMIGYVQQSSASWWYSKLNLWIRALARAGENGWTGADVLSPDSFDPLARVLSASSAHTRPGTTPITLFHLLVEM